MTEDEIRAVKSGLFQASLSRGGFTESEAEYFARAAITALDQYREGKADAKKVTNFVMLPGDRVIYQLADGSIGDTASPTKEEGR